MSRLYDYIASQAYRTKFAEANKLTDDILKVEEHEMAAHQNVWKKRGALLIRIQHVLREINTEVSAIIESAEISEQILPLEEDKNVHLGPTS